jgi:hypothetical protein
MLNPKVISEVAVRIQDIINCSYAMRVRSRSNLAETLSSGAGCAD